MKPAISLFFKRLLLALCSVLMLFVLIDLLTYFVLDIKVSGHDPGRFFRYDSELGWSMIPGAEGYWYRYEEGWKKYVRINRHGFSDSERKLVGDKTRIALIGDSVTQCWEVEEDKRIHNAMQRKVPADYEVMNFGVRGFGTDQTYILLTNEVHRFTPDILVYTLCINDIWNNSDANDKPFFEEDPVSGELQLAGCPVVRSEKSLMYGADRKIRNYSYMYRRLSDLQWHAWDRWKRLARKAGIYKEEASPALSDVNRDFELRPLKRQYNDTDEARMSRTLDLIGLISDYAREKGMKLLVVESVYRPAIWKKQQQKEIAQYGKVFDFAAVTMRLSEYAEPRGIEVLSLREAAIAAGHDENWQLTHPYDHMHYSATGAEFYAGRVVDELKRLGWVAP